MSNRKWFSELDYKDNMKIGAKILYWLGIIKYAPKRQSYGGGWYCGRFRFVPYNPLTWVFILLFFLLLLVVGIIDGAVKAAQTTIEFWQDGVKIEIDSDYKNK